jgi:hypothetical protein
VKTQVQPQPEIKQDTQIKPAEQVQAQPQKQVKSDTKVEKKQEIVKTPEQLQQEADQIRYNDNSEARLGEITTNLNNAAVTNPSSLKDADTFINTYSVNDRSPQQRKAMMNWY